MTNPLFAVYPQFPTSPIESWEQSVAKWDSLSRDLAVAEMYSPITVKALYVTGLILAFGRSVNILLSPNYLTSTTYYPAYAIFAASIDLLGRCLRGNHTTKDTTKDIQAGFKWLFHPVVDAYKDVSPDDVVIRTLNFGYTINDLVAIRNFAAHGQATIRGNGILKEFDYLLLGAVPPFLAEAVQSYLILLRSEESLADNLAKAAIEPYRNRPIFDTLWQANSMEADKFPDSIAEVIQNFDWSYKFPLNRLGSPKIINP